MKALMINSLSSGGAERIVLNIFRHLKAEGREIILICLVKNNVYEIRDNENIIYLSAGGSLKRGAGISKFLIFPILLFRLRKIISKYNIDLIQSHLYSSCILNAFLRLLGSIHKIQMVNHMHISYEKGFKLGGFLKIASLKFAYNRSDMIISISEKMKMDINKNILNKNIDHVVISNPHDIDLIISKTHELPAFEFKENGFYIATSGRLVKRKKVKHLIEAFYQVQKTRSNCELIILGDGEEMPVLKNQVKNLGIESIVHFIGHVENPFKYIKRSDLFVLASESEGLPNVLIEALLCKTYVISCDCQTGPREIIAPESDLNYQLAESIEIAKHGILIPVNKVMEITNSINYFIDHKEILGKNIENSFMYAQRYSIQNIIKKYDQIMF